MKESMDNWPTDGPDNPLNNTEREPPVRVQRIVPTRDPLASRDAQRKLLELHNAPNSAIIAALNNAYHLGFQEGWKARGNAEVSEVAVADSTKTSGVRPPLSLD